MCVKSYAYYYHMYYQKACVIVQYQLVHAQQQVHEHRHMLLMDYIQLQVFVKWIIFYGGDSCDTCHSDCDHLP